MGLLSLGRIIFAGCRPRVPLCLPRFFGAGAEVDILKGGVLAHCFRELGISLEVDYGCSLALTVVRILCVDECGGADLLKVCAFIAL